MAKAQDQPIRSLALGDSYTIGESVSLDKSWPMQLAMKMKREGVLWEDPIIIAKTGWTTSDLIAELAKFDGGDDFDYVSLLIGVNNQYRGLAFSTYEKEWKILVKKAIDFVSGNKTRVFVISIPDYGVTPFASGKHPLKISTEIDAYNSYVQDQCERMGIRFIDITTDSRLAKAKKELVASDGLHPSEVMYAHWVEMISPWIMKGLDKIKR